MKRLTFTLLSLLFATAVMAQQAAEVMVIGHRGGRAEFEENTLAAFKGSFENGVRGYETDIRMTADGELVILHDASLKRITGVDLDVEKSTRKEIKKIKTKQGNPILFLDELVEYFRGSDIAYIEWEMKSKNYTPEQLEIYCDKIYNIVMASKPKDALYIFSSFDERALHTMKRLHPEAECALIVSAPMSDDLIEHLNALGLKRVACGVEGTSRKAMKAAHKAGIVVNLWPGKSIEDFQLAVALGADIACTDIPVEVLKSIKKRTPWITPRKKLTIDNR